MSGAVIDPDRLVIGTEEGLFCLDLDRSGKSSNRVSHRSRAIMAI